MPRGPDLSPNEVAMVHSKIKQFWDYEKAQIKHGGTKEIRKSCKISGIPVSERTLRRIAAEMNRRTRFLKRRVKLPASILLPTELGNAGD